jgi:N-acetylglucosamine-6-sulfatase
MSTCGPFPTLAWWLALCLVGSGAWTGVTTTGTGGEAAEAAEAGPTAAGSDPGPDWDSRLVTESTKPQRPNIVILMLDDVSPHDGRLWEHLPTIRRTFVRQGVEFTDFHGETPTCCPGRVAFLTGLHTDHHGVRWNNGRLFRPGMTIATQLRRVGYHTIFSGKYLNVFDLVTPKHPPGWHEFHANGGDWYDYALWSNGRREWHGRRPGDYSTDVFTRKALASLRRAPRRRPVLLWLAPYAAHMPNPPAPRHRDDPRCASIPRWAPPNYMERDVSDKPAYIRRRPLRAPRGYDLRPACRSLLSVDDMLRRVVRELRRQGRLNDTLLVLTADNGMNYGAHRYLHDKKTPYATRIPFFASWPRALGATRRTIDERIQNIDLAPTLCELAGCRMGPYPTGQRRADGVSFARLLLGRGQGPRRAAVIASFRTRGAAVPRWYGVETTRHSPLARIGCAAADQGGCRWSYVVYETGERELYDVSNGPCWTWVRGQPGDPCRLDNRAGDPGFRSIERQLRTLLRELRERSRR